MDGPEEHACAEPERHHARTYMTPYVPEPDGTPGRSRPVTAALLAVALVVAVGAGGAVHSVLDDDGPEVAPTAPPAPVTP